MKIYKQQQQFNKQDELAKGMSSFLLFSLLPALLSTQDAESKHLVTVHFPNMTLILLLCWIAEH